MSDMLSMGGVLLSVGAPFVIALAYVLALWESRRDGDADTDTQIGLKLVVYALMVVALGIAAGGLASALYFLVSGAHPPASVFKEGLASIIAGGGVLVALGLLILPRTNAATHTRSSRYFLGYVAAVTGIVAISSLSSVVNSVVNWSSWARLASPLTGVIVYGGLAFLSLNRFGALSGWSAPVRAPRPQAAAQQQAFAQQPYAGQQAYAQPQQGYQQPQQQGFPQQQAYPGQQQAYPQPGQPQQQGYPQPGQPGGGLPPPGGYNPQGGGYQR